MNDTHLILLGEIKGRLDEMQTGQQTLLEKVDGIDERLRTVEKRSAFNGAIAGGVVAVGLALIKQTLTGP